MGRLKSVICTGLIAGVVLGGEGAIAQDLTRDAEIPLLRAANSWGAPTLDFPMQVLSHRGVLVLAPVGLSLATNPKDFSTPLVILGAESLAYLGSRAGKAIFNRQRPYEAFPDLRLPDGPEDTASFPSSHAAISFAAATALADSRPDLAIPAYTLAVLISYSRLYNGVHYPSDLLAGALLGVGTAKLTRWGVDHLPRPLQPSLTGPKLTLSLQEGWRLGFETVF